MKKEDLERFTEFEREINSGDNGVKYKPDLSIEAQVKLEFLIETFGNEKVADVLVNMKKEEKDLSDTETYSIVYSILQVI